MRLGHWTWLTILLLALLAGGPTIHRALAASTDPLNDASLLPLHATLARQDALPPAVYLDSDASLSLELGTDKPAYLVGETVQITVKTNLKDTRVRLSAQYEDGSKQEVTSATISSSRTVEWTATKAGRVELVCDGQATTRVLEWTTCTGVGSAGGRLYIYTYPCQQYVDKTVKETASRTLRIYPRETYISGRVVDKLQKPVAGAVVTLQSSRQTTTTDRDGYYQFPSYELGTNYTLVGNVPTVTEIVTVEAVACEPLRQSIQVKAGSGAPNSDFTLERFFYPPAIDLSDFDAKTFSGWAQASRTDTWRNVLGIAVDGSVTVTKLLFERRELPSDSIGVFRVGGKKLYLIPSAEPGRYFVEIESDQSAEYEASCSATLQGVYIGEDSLKGSIRAGKTQRFRIVLRQDRVKLEHSRGVPVVLLVLPTIFGLFGGLAAAFFITGGQLSEVQRAFAGIKMPQMQIALLSGRRNTKGRARSRKSIAKGRAPAARKSGRVGQASARRVRAESQGSTGAARPAEKTADNLAKEEGAG